MAASQAQTFYARRGKQLLDALLVIVAAPLWLPLLGIVALVVRLGVGSPVLFRHRRPGLGAKPFVLYKFRSMLDVRDAHGCLLPDEERLTAWGRFLRSTSLDELPELVNVLKGEMSLVGPRPLLMEYLERYSPEQARRHEVRPGISGWAQVNGRNTISWDHKFAHDVWYVDHISIWLDIRILGMTVWKALRREGISQSGYATAAEFMGNEEV